MNLEDLTKEVPKEANEELEELLQSVNTKTMPQDDKIWIFYNHVKNLDREVPETPRPPLFGEIQI